MPLLKLFSVRGMAQNDDQGFMLKVVELKFSLQRHRQKLLAFAKLQLHFFHIAKFEEFGELFPGSFVSSANLAPHHFILDNPFPQTWR